MGNWSREFVLCFGGSLLGNPSRDYVGHVFGSALSKSKAGIDNFPVCEGAMLVVETDHGHVMELKPSIFRDQPGHDPHLCLKQFLFLQWIVKWIGGGVGLVGCWLGSLGVPLGDLIKEWMDCSHADLDVCAFLAFGGYRFRWVQIYPTNFVEVWSITRPKAAHAAFLASWDTRTTFVDRFYGDILPYLIQ